MGTSTNQASPRSLGWDAVAAGYQNEQVPIDRVVQELWRAALTQSDANWAEIITSPAVSTCLKAAMESDNPVDALSRATRDIFVLRQSSLVADIAKRATVQCFAAENRVQGFAEAMFKEVSNYLVSRDLPSHVGANQRNRNVGESLQFKADVTSHVIQLVRRSGAFPPSFAVESWGNSASQAVALLSGRSQ